MDLTNTSKLSIATPSYNTFNANTLKSLKKPNILKYISQTERSINDKSSSLPSRFTPRNQRIKEGCLERSATEIRQMLERCKSIQEGIKFRRD